MSLLKDSILPPIEGYVEDEVNGERVYRNAKTGILKSEEGLPEIELLQAQNKALSDRADFLEDCIAEMAMEVYGGV